MRPEYKRFVEIASPLGKTKYEWSPPGTLIVYFNHDECHTRWVGRIQTLRELMKAFVGRESFTRPRDPARDPNIEEPFEWTTPTEKLGTSGDSSRSSTAGFCGSSSASVT